MSKKEDLINEIIGNIEADPYGIVFGLIERIRILQEKNNALALMSITWKPKDYANIQHLKYSREDWL